MNGRLAILFGIEQRADQDLIDYRLFGPHSFIPSQAASNG
jgi:hypothetical protein